MDLAARISQQFEEHLQVQVQVMPALVEPLVGAANLLVNGLLEGGKVLCCGNGGSAASVQHFTSMMLNGLGRERPGLPAVTLTADTSVLSGIASREGFGNAYAHQVGALGHPGDILLVIGASGSPGSLVNAVSTAIERQMKIILLSGRENDDLAQLLRECDIELRVPLTSLARIHEVHLLIIHCLNDLVDAQLLGA